MAQKIEKEIRDLSMEDMLTLHERLLIAIEERESGQNFDPAYADEIRKRIRQIDSAEVKGMDAFQALDEM